MRALHLKCAICGNSSSNTTYVAREMMFGLRDEFTYFQCAQCSCLQIEDTAIDFQRYYPRAYYAHSAAAHAWPIRLLLRFRNAAALLQQGLLGTILDSYRPNHALRSLRPLRLSRDARILDVGCGTGQLLSDLTELGFHSTFGVDPHIEADVILGNRVLVRKCHLRELDETDEWDVIMFHHSFEHMPDQLETLECVSKSLSRGGTCILRIPTSSSKAWRTFSTNWVQLDAPRHFFLHSSESVRLLASQAGLKVINCLFDSTAFQFWGSKQYEMDIPLFDGASFAINPAKSPFTAKDIDAFSKEAVALNRQNLGDQAAFYLTKA